MTLSSPICLAVAALPRRLQCAALVALALTGLVRSSVAEAPDPPPFYAIRDVRVEVGDGQVLERATVLVGRGLIEGVGPDLEIPGEARIIDGAGLTLYPGLTDSLTTLGLALEAEPEGGEARGRPQGKRPIRGPEDRPRTTPWVSAADLLAAEPNLEKWRQAGFTAAVVAPPDGIFAGQSALLHLGEAEPRDRVIAAGLAQRLNFDTSGGFRSYPGSLMGVLAYISQVLLDAEHYGAARSFYGDDPRGRQRPLYDQALESLVRAQSARQSFMLPAQRPREIDRALRLADEHGLEAIVYGGQGAYARVERLRAAGAAVLVSLEWPAEEKDRDPEAETAFRTYHHRRLARVTPQRLAAAGIPFAFYSEGISSPTRLFENLRTAIEAGLEPGAALRAMTSAAAEIVGVGNRLGTIETGKIANLVLATAAPWSKDVEIRDVFVDGRRYAQRVDDETGEPPSQDVSGTWELTVETRGGPRDARAELEMSADGKVKGEIESERGTSDIEKGRLSGDLLRFEITRSRGGRSMQVTYSLTVHGDRLSGSASAGPMRLDVEGERTAQATEKKDEDDAAGPAAVSIAELEAVHERYQGPVSERHSFAIEHARIYTVSGETIEDGTVVVRQGIIRAVGAAVDHPEDLEVIDARGASLIPGIIDAHSHIAIDGGGNEGALAVTSMVSIGDVLDADDINIYRALAGGVTTANILHGSANPIGGQNAVIKLRWGADAAGLVFAAAPPGIKLALGENPKHSNMRRSDSPPRYPQTRMGVMDVIRRAFTEARLYRQEWRSYEGDRKRRREPAPRRDLELEPLVEILAGERLVHAHCYRADEILQLLRLGEEFGFRIATLQHVLEGYKVADEIAAHGAGASTFSDWWGYKIEAYDAIPHNASLMAERGVLVSINSDSAEEMRHLNQEAAKSMRFGGMSEIQALRLVTLNPAQQLGIAEHVGSIEVGKDADLTLLDGPPMALRSRVLKTFVDGILYFDSEADRERQGLVDAIKQRLEGKGDEKEPEREKDPAPTSVPASVEPEQPWQAGDMLSEDA